jgi:hypothetical protein
MTPILGGGCGACTCAGANTSLAFAALSVPLSLGQDKFSKVWTKLMGPNSNVFQFEVDLTPVWPKGSRAPVVPLAIADPIQLVYELLHDVHK